MDILNDIKNVLFPVVAKSAPILASVLGTPLAGVAVSLIANAFGVDPSTPEKILSAIQGDPDAALKLKEIELDHEVQLKQIALDAYQAQLLDVQNARAAMVATEQFTGKKDWLITFLVVMAVLLFGFCLVAAYFAQGVANQMFLFLIGQQSGVYLSIYAFYFSGIDPKKMFDNVVSQNKVS